MIVPGAPEHLPAKRQFMETAGIEPALRSRQDDPEREAEPVPVLQGKRQYDLVRAAGLLAVVILLAAFWYLLITELPW